MPEQPQFSPEQGDTRLPSIDEQIKRKQSVDVLDGVVEFTEVRPEQETTKVPLLIAPGWGGDIAAAFKEGMRTYAESGQRSIAIEHPSTVKQVPERMPKELTKEHTLTEVRKAAAYLEFLDKQGIEQADVFAHSEGAIYVLLAAAAAPERFRNIVLANPAGMLGKDNLFKFAVRSARGAGKPGVAFPGEKWQEPPSDKKSGGVLGYVLRNPRVAAGDFVAITRSDVYGLLKHLHEKGVRIAIMAGVEDNMFPPMALQDAVKAEDIDGYLSVRGGHTAVLDHPKEYSRGVASVLRALQKKGERQAV